MSFQAAECYTENPLTVLAFGRKIRTPQPGPLERTSANTLVNCDGSPWNHSLISALWTSWRMSGFCLQWGMKNSRRSSH